MEVVAFDLEVKTPSFKLSKIEKKASEIVPFTTNELKASEFGVESSLRELPEEIITKYPCKNIANTTELCALINDSNSALDMKKMLDTQYSRESDLESIINYLELLKLKGLVTF